jgi:hypothetical protein
MLGALEVKRIAKIAARHGKEWKTIHTAVLDCIYAHRNRRTKNCWPSRSLIAKHCRKSERQIDRVIKQLREWGALEHQRPRKVSNGRFGGRQFTISFEDPRDISPRDISGVHHGTLRSKARERSKASNTDPPTSSRTGLRNRLSLPEDR